MPSNCVLAVAGLGLRALGGFAAQRFDLGVDLLQRVLGNDRAFGEIAVALVRDLHALATGSGWPARNSNLSSTLPGSKVVSPGVSICTFRNICATMISMCLSSISTRWLR